MVTLISAPITSILGTLQHYNRIIEGSLLAKHAEKYAINVNEFRSASIMSALLWTPHYLPKDRMYIYLTYI